jgi:beta-glucosidase
MKTENKMEEKIKNMILEMTLEEKVSMLAGADMWHTVPVERLDIPVLKVSDGPNGTRGSESRTGPRSACFPVGVALAATWNTELGERVGMALAEETRAKGAHILLAPTVNIHRSPLAGRNFECYSEDPYLTARMAVAYINGLQGGGVGACIKHFVCNDSEFERFSMSSEVGERALWEIYLEPFRQAINEAKPWSVMSAYNKINGTYASENAHLLLDILKGDWGFDGIVISDWYGTYSRNAAKNGLDLEMPGPARWSGKNLVRAVRAGELDEGVIDEKVRRILHVFGKAGIFDDPEPQTERAEDKPEHRQLIRQVGAEAIVLLKNENDILPLLPEKIESIAVIGENAMYAQVMGGGSAQVTPHYVVSPLEGIQSRAGKGIEVSYAIGCKIDSQPPLINTDWLAAEDGTPNGLTLQYYDNMKLSGQPVHSEVTDRMELTWFGEKAKYINPRNFSIRLSGMLSVPERGEYTFNVSSVGACRLFIDNVEKIVIPAEHPAGLSDWDEVQDTIELELDADRLYAIKLEYIAEPRGRSRVMRLGCMRSLPENAIEEAVELGRKSDVAIVYAGWTKRLETEGVDRPSMELPGDQAELIRQVAAANPNTIVVLNTGSPVNMDWLDDVPAVVQSWYLGQEAGNAIADVLFGDVNPSGKLTTTFPRRIQDNPAYLNYPGENGRVLYGEGIFVGYRYYDKKEIKPLFPFGYGLSYTTFDYSNLLLNAEEFRPDETIQVSLDVKNTGPVPGKEIVQLYIQDIESRLVRPEVELKAFTKVSLDPGETKPVSFTLNKESLSFYDPAVKGWVAEPGEFEVLIGSSSRDIRLRRSFLYLESTPDD